MSTDEVKKLIVDGDIFMQDKDGEISKIAEIQNLESVQENNQDDAADAVRYAIEKETYIVQWTCEFIGNNLHLLTEKDRQVMIRDIENPISYGDECDKVCWMQLLEKLRKENITNEKAKSRKSRKEKQR